MIGKCPWLAWLIFFDFNLYPVIFHFWHQISNLPDFCRNDGKSPDRGRNRKKWVLWATARRIGIQPTARTIFYPMQKTIGEYLAWVSRQLVLHFKLSKKNLRFQPAWNFKSNFEDLQNSYLLIYQISTGPVVSSHFFLSTVTDLNILRFTR